MTGNKSKFFKGVSVQSAITITIGLMELIVFSLMSRLLSKSDFGYFAALSGITTICTSITEAGLGSAIIQKKDASISFIQTAFSLSWIFGGLGSIILFVFAPSIAGMIADLHLTLPLRVMSINIFLACIASVGKSILVRNLKFKIYGTYEIIAYASSSFIGIVLAFLDFGLYALVSISICNLILLNIMLYFRQIKLPKMRVVKKEIKDIMSFGGWLTLSVVVNNITQQMDRLFLSKWLSVSILGSYNRPAGFVSTITGKINGIFDMVLFPMLSKIQDDPLKIKNVFTQALRLLNSFSAVLFAIFFFNAELIITVFFGKNWLELTPILRIISVYIIFNIDNRLVDCFFRSLGYVDIGFYIRVVSAILTFSSLYIGAKYGLYGVAVSLVCANIITVIIKIIVLSRKVNVNLFTVVKSFFIAEKPLIPLIIIGIPFLFFAGHSLIENIVFAIIMSIIICVQFILFPKTVSYEYTQMVYPLVRKGLNKIRR